MSHNISKEYTNESIAEVLRGLNGHKIVLPALQRKYVWETEQIESLFDSLMQGYPIGTFLFWNIDRNSIEGDYTFYDFIKNYDKRRIKNEKATIYNDKVIAVLDGQQRLTSLYLSLYGSYTEKLPGKWHSNADAWEEKFLYINLISIDTEFEDYKYEFKFLTKKEALEKKEQKVWYKVSKILNWGDTISNNPNKDYRKLKSQYKDINLNREEVFTILKLLHRRVVKDDYLTYFNLTNMEIDEVLDIFIRVNSGGVKLTKSDLLMSTITVSWDKARDNVDELLTKINTNERFEFNIDFVMRTALVLLDEQILFKVKNFDLKTVSKIKEQWNHIAESIIEATKLLVEFGFDERTLTSKNAVIPIIYYIFKGGHIKDQERSQLKLYLQTALINRFYGSHGDQKLAGLRNRLRDNETYELKSKRFNFNDIRDISLSGSTLMVTEEDIEVFLTEKKGKYAYVVLSLLYPELNNEAQYDQDHIFPSDNFSNKNLQTLNLTKEEIEELIEMKDQIPNLQIMGSRKNRVKNNSQFKDWFDSLNQDEQRVYLQHNYIPENISYDFKDFKNFFNRRKELLKEKLTSVLIRS